MTTYLDVGVVRIGEYVARVPRLRSIRAASAAISAATDRVRDEAGVNGLAGCRPHDEAGRADGVLHLVVDAGSAEQVARSVLGELRSDLPAADLEARWADGATYTEARSEMFVTGRAADRLRWLPPTLESPVLRPCRSKDDPDEGCAQRPGNTDANGLCDDCATRVRWAESARDSRAWGLLRDSLVASPPRELRSLCRPWDSPPESNHLATIAADGNGVGQVFTRLLSGSPDAAGKAARLSAALTTATEHAFVEAARSLHAAGSEAPVVPIVLGGDDLVVVTAAAHAWRFVGELQRSFARAIADSLGDTGEGVSMSAGVLVHPEKHPIAQSVAMAERLMRRAKTAHAGASAATAWADLTRDDPSDSSLGSRPTVTVEVLERQHDALVGLGSLGGSTRASLARAIDDLAEAEVSPVTAARYLGYQADRVGAAPAVQPFTSDSADIELGDALDLTRWYR